MKSLRNAAKATLRLLLHALGSPFPAAGPRVLVYHSVDTIDSPISVTPQLFAAQMDYLRRKRYTTWTAGRFVDALCRKERLPRRLVVLTFDDGYLNNVTRALPILEQRGLCATVFMVTQNDGALPRWGERDGKRIAEMVHQVYPGDAREKEEVLARTMATLSERIATWDELRGAPQRGLEVLSHTRTHPYMDAVDDAQLDDELAGSRADLRAHDLGDCNSLAWPYGAHDDRAIAAATAAGYRGTFLGDATWRGRKHPDPLRLDRISIDPSLGVFGMAFQLGRGYDLWLWLRALRRRNAG